MTLFISLEKEAYVNSATRSWATEYRANQKADLETYKWVDKKAGIVTHPAPGNETGTLVQALLYHTKKKLSNIQLIRHVLDYS